MPRTTEQGLLEPAHAEVRAGGGTHSERGHRCWFPISGLVEPREAVRGQGPGTRAGLASLVPVLPSEGGTERARLLCPSWERCVRSVLVRVQWGWPRCLLPVVQSVCLVT